jgi:hypothetical protein
MGFVEILTANQKMTFIVPLYHHHQQMSGSIAGATLIHLTKCGKGFIQNARHHKQKL